MLRPLNLTFVLLSNLVLSSFLISPLEMWRQGSLNPGNNAVFNSSSVCCTGSSAFIDAFILAGAQDICTTIYNILNGTIGKYAPGAVIDARGISGTTALTCPANTSPWFKQSTGYLNKPSTILLPAGTIMIPKVWILPNGTKLIGEGTTNPALNLNNSQLQTTIQATTALSSGPMIQFGDSNCPGASPTCTGISIESLTLYGNGNLLTGIQNQNAQALSYVNHVTLYHVLGTGLAVSGNALNSGPYSNINYDTGTSGVWASTCASINGLNGTKGIHGLSCFSSPDSQNAVLLDSSNNTLEDVRIMGFINGIYVGSLAPAQGNVLLNIRGDTTESVGAPPNVVHIANVGNAVTDLAIVGVANQVMGTNIIQDDVTGTTLISSTQANSYVGMYVLGEPKTNAGYSRYTTSPSAPNWSVGGNTPSNTIACAQGSLYSCIGSTSNCTYALYGCSGSGWKGIK